MNMDSTNELRYDIKKNFGLTPDEFNLYLNNLKKGDEMLFEIVFKEHFERCRTFLIRKLDADSDIAYDITLETLIKFRKNLIADKIKYGNLAALFTIDARNNYLRWSDKESKYEHVSAESQEDTIIDEPALNNLDIDLVDKLKIELRNIGNDCFELLNWHYYLKMSLRAIGENRFQRGDEKFVNESSVKTKIAECRKKLRSLLN
jgi:DNA-directed RNA polymerase specialized sigma24 family protein